MDEDALEITDGYVCGLGVAFHVISGKWKAVILCLLDEKPRRFGALKRELPGISERILINQLKELEANGVISRHDFRQIPPRVEYTITPLGKTLCKALEPLSQWGLRHENSIGNSTQDTKRA